MSCPPDTGMLVDHFTLGSAHLVCARVRVSCLCHPGTPSLAGVHSWARYSGDIKDAIFTDCCMILKKRIKLFTREGELLIVPLACLWKSDFVQCSNIFTLENLEVEEGERTRGRESHAPGWEVGVDVPPAHPPGHRLPTPPSCFWAEA